MPCAHPVGLPAVRVHPNYRALLAPHDPHRVDTNKGGTEEPQAGPVEKRVFRETRRCLIGMRSERRAGQCSVEVWRIRVI